MCLDNQPDTINTGINDTEVESANVMPLNVDHNVSAKNVCPMESDTNINSASEQMEIQHDSISDQIPSDNLHLSASNFHRNYKHFSVKQKMEVVEFWKLHGIRTAAKHFKIPKSSVSRWCKTDFTSCVLDKKGILPKSGRPLTYPEELDQKILEYILEQCDLQNAVSIEDICIYSAELIQPVSSGFAASRSWALSFMKRHDLSLCAKTSISQHLPHDLEEKFSSFHQFVKTKHEEDEFDNHLIINMEETPVYFE